MLKPIFKGEEVKMEKKIIPFQYDQMKKIISILGFPKGRLYLILIFSYFIIVEEWPLLTSMPDFDKIQEFHTLTTCNLWKIYSNASQSKSHLGYDLLSCLLHYDPNQRMTPDKALKHGYFEEFPRPCNK